MRERTFVYTPERAELDRQIAEAERKVVEAALAWYDSYFAPTQVQERNALADALDALEELLKRRGEME
jgi:hypothetical protein